MSGLSDVGVKLELGVWAITTIVVSKNRQSLLANVASRLMQSGNTAPACPANQLCFMQDVSTYLSIEHVDSFGPLFLSDPMLNDLGMVTVEVRIEQIQVCTPMTQDKLVNHLGVEVILRISYFEDQRQGSVPGR
jgi:hypothetical protein